MQRKTVLFLLVLMLSSFVSGAWAAKIGYVDSTRILKEYKEAKQLLQDIADKESKLNKKLQAKRQEIQKAKEQKKTDTELQMMAEKIRMELEPEAKAIEQESARRSRDIEDTVEKAINDYAAKSKYDLVVVKESILFGGTDVTTEILSKLNK